MPRPKLKNRTINNILVSVLYLKYSIEALNCAKIKKTIDKIAEIKTIIFTTTPLLHFKFKEYYKIKIIYLFIIYGIFNNGHFNRYLVSRIKKETS